MNLLWLLIVLFGSIAVLVTILYLAARKQLETSRQQQAQAGMQQAQLESRQQYYQQLLEEKKEEVQEKQQRLDHVYTQFQDMNADLHRVQEQNRHLQQLLATEKHQLQEVQQQMQLQFEHTAQQLLQRISGSFMEQNQLKMQDVLQPLSEKIESFRSSVQQSLVSETAQRAALHNELQRLLQLNQTLTQEANNLTNALKADTKKQGNWGEMVLERVLQASGLEKGIHYSTQESGRDEAGNLKRPDLLLQLPDNRQLIIDSKVSLKAYEQYCHASTDVERQQALKAHLQSVKNHVDELSRKQYPLLYNNTTDFVLLFIPIEPAYGLAVLHQDDLYDYAFRRRVIMVSVPALLATLRIIDSMWRLEHQNKNAEEIVRQGTALYDKFVGFVDDMRAIGIQLGRSQEAYDSAMNKLSSGKGNLISRTENMRRLGLDNKKEIPREMTDRMKGDQVSGPDDTEDVSAALS
ncbi:DNA recombination protein RmuC [Chitinophaga pendula]|uniref:DNA recombination protein RmuC n=1 Tax=Chitinophaga TaxID=79328 RepID=UPI000BAED3AE|nr:MULTISPECIES: DNA recombination protein RmuC [Chitinophaga]ASZ10409.1 DNA recombination protein RmuC [Chitinophaga sp. MD30]UCJ06624.1 DNA recombination protein RmuC [Chitinophaga pendula]